ncbi:hypothetical protein LWI28_015582 [Acer negundo]|uniref:Uncharacterized protein n=1 Tax=Acer negundo TaxID=4023 RepID=A0AAD5J661_ACENE|nr:hypothetical protein LWI28_015582 [Acer negundo]
MEDFSDSESNNDDLDTRRNRFGQNKTESDRRGKDFEGRDNYNYVNDDARFRSKEDSNRDDNGGRRMNNKKGDSRIFKEPKHEGSRGSKQGMSHKYDMNADNGSNGFKNSRRVIERKI